MDVKLIEVRMKKKERKSAYQKQSMRKKVKLYEFIFLINWTQLLHSEMLGTGE